MRISVIIPVFNEEKLLGAALSRLKEDHAPYEIIVCDGGSHDRSVGIARQWARVIRTGKGRALQMNAGASEARGDLFLFLHADTVLPDKALESIERAVQAGKEGGRFRLKFDRKAFLLKLFSWYTRFHGFSYGDQSFFVKRELFFRLDGFREDVPFEDMDFYRRLRHFCEPVILKSKVTTSSRRFDEMGSLRQKFINILLVSLYHAGFDIRLNKEKLYPDIR